MIGFEMKFLKKTLLATMLMTSMVGMASAALVTGSNSTPQSIPDNNNNGLTSTVSIGTNGTINSLSVTVGVSHTWLGDLFFKLTHGSTSVILMDRPGFSGTGFGDSTDLNSFYPLSFRDSATVAAEDIGVGCDTFDIVGEGALCMNLSFRPDQALSAFTGVDVFGDWVLTISDNAAGDIGRLANWSLNADVGNSVPEPGSLALLGLGMAGLAYLRNRKTQGKATRV